MPTISGGMPSLAILIARKKHPTLNTGDMMSPDEEDQEATPDQSDAEEHAAQEICDACKKGDAAALKDALQAFLEICYPQLEKEEDSASDETKY